MFQSARYRPGLQTGISSLSASLSKFQSARYRPGLQTPRGGGSACARSFSVGSISARSPDGRERESITLPAFQSARYRPGLQTCGKRGHDGVCGFQSARYRPGLQTVNDINVSGVEGFQSARYRPGLQTYHKLLGDPTVSFSRLDIGQVSRLNQGTGNPSRVFQSARYRPGLQTAWSDFCQRCQRAATPHLKKKLRGEVIVKTPAAGCAFSRCGCASGTLANPVRNGVSPARNVTGPDRQSGRRMRRRQWF